MSAELRVERGGGHIFYALVPCPPLYHYYNAYDLLYPLFSDYLIGLTVMTAGVIRKRDDTVSARDAEIAGLQIELADLRAAHAPCKTEIKELQSNMVRLESALAEKAQKEVALTTQLDEAKLASKQMTALRRHIKETNNALQHDDATFKTFKEQKVSQSVELEQQLNARPRVKLGAAPKTRVKLGSGVPPLPLPLPTPLASNASGEPQTTSSGFVSFDLDGDGVLSVDEFVQRLTDTGWSLQEAEQAFRDLDRNGDGGVSAQEFEAWIKVADKKLEAATLTNVATLRQHLAEMREAHLSSESALAQKDMQVKQLQCQTVELGIEAEGKEERRKERVIKTFSLRLKHAFKCKVYASWLVNAKGRRRQRTGLCRLALRMSHAGAYKAWLTWHDHAHELRTQRVTLHKIALRMKSLAIFAAWRKWEFLAKQIRRQRNAMQKIVLKIANATMHKVFARFVEVHRQRVLLERHLSRMRKAVAYKAYAIWRDHACEIRRQRWVLEKRVLRMKNGLLLKSWATWNEHAREMRRQRSVLERLALRMKDVFLFKGWTAPAYSRDMVCQTPRQSSVVLSLAAASTILYCGVGGGGAGGGCSRAMGWRAHATPESCMAGDSVKIVDAGAGPGGGGQTRGMLAKVFPLAGASKDVSKGQRHARYLQAKAEVKAAQKRR